MKRLVEIIACMLIVAQASAQPRRNNKTMYGFSSTIVQTNSGFGPALGMSFNVTDNRKMLSAGLLLSNDPGNTLSGLRFEFKYELSNNRRSAFHYYIQTQHMLRRDRTSYANFLKSKGIETTTTNATQMEMRSVEHYIGLGSEIRLIDGLYLDTGIGVGAYIASPKKLQSDSESFIGAKTTTGFGYTFKAGVGYRF
jgi:hypothetical protein